MCIFQILSILIPLIDINTNNLEQKLKAWHKKGLHFQQKNNFIFLAEANRVDL